LSGIVIIVNSMCAIIYHSSTPCVSMMNDSKQQIVTGLMDVSLRVLLRSKKDELDVHQKQDSTPVTNLDLWLHHEISSILRKSSEEVIVSEESAYPSALPNLYWLIDPIDGTRDLIAGRPEWTINVALIENGEVVWGFVSAPDLKEVFVGDVKAGSAISMKLCTPSECALVSPYGTRSEKREGPCVNGAKLLQLNSDSHPRLRGPGQKVAVSFSHRDPQTEALIDQLLEPQKVVVGSSLKFCRLAQGLVDWYPRGHGLNDWDIAAGHAVLKAAGGNVRDWHGEEIRYGNDPDGKTVAFEAW
jgi:3'(2'), 5'-bisphosphate nucleotidase